MRKRRQSPWSGVAPTDEAKAKKRLADAAIACAHRTGLAKTTIADIAREAGVTRPTVYAYFDDLTAIFEEAFETASDRLLQRSLKKLKSLDDPAEVAVETVLYWVTELPKDPALSLAFSGAGVSAFIPRALQSPETLRRGHEALGPFFALLPQLDERPEELIEVFVRFVVSFLATPSPSTRTRAQLREFLHRRMVPALGLPEVSARPKRGRT